MTLKHIAAASLALAAIVSLGGCEALQNLGIGKKVEKDTSYLPSDREQILLESAAKTYNSKDLEHGIVKGDWAIETVDGMEVTGETPPYLRFVPEEKRVYGNNGCNTLNAEYIYNPQDSTLVFSNILTTMRACPGTTLTETMISNALGSVKYYRWEAVDSQYFFRLLDADKNEVMKLMHQNFDFLNGTWRVTAIDGEPVAADNIKMVIDVDEGKIHGYSGCNTFNGTMEIDMATANCISFQAFTKTKVACPPNMNYELPLMVALEEARTARAISADKVLLISHAGKVVLNLERTSD